MADSDASSGSSSSSSSDSVLIRVPLDQKRRKKLRAQLQEEQRRQRERQTASPRLKADLDSERSKGELICVICEHEGDDLVVCTGPCISAFHVKCLPSGSVPEYRHGDWLCPSCKNKTHACFHCKRTGVETLAAATSADATHRPVRKCRALSCGKFYHQNCITQFPLARIAINTHFICPLHTCAGCNQSGAQQEAVRCMRCPVAYHAKCLPPKCVRQISSKLIICPRHQSTQSADKSVTNALAAENEDDVIQETSVKKEKKEKREKREKKKKKKKKKKDKHKRESQGDEEHDEETSGKKRKRSKRDSMEMDDMQRKSRPVNRSNDSSVAPSATLSVNAVSLTSNALLESQATATKRIQERLEEALGKSEDDDSDTSAFSSALKKKQLSYQITHELADIKEEQIMTQEEQMPSQTDASKSNELSKSPIPSSPLPESSLGEKDSAEARSSAEEDTFESKTERGEENEQQKQPEVAEEVLKLEIPASSSLTGAVIKRRTSVDEHDDDEGIGGLITPGADTPRTPRGGRAPGKKKRKSKAKREAQRIVKRETSEEEEGEGSEAKWVQCDSCKKWRTVPREFNLDDMPKHWYCHMNTWDDRFASCSVAEEVVKTNPSPQVDKRKYKPKKSKLIASGSIDEGYSSSGSGPLKQSVKGSTNDMEDKEKSVKSNKASKKRKMTKRLKEKYREVKWVQCESPQCGKWRVVPTSINFDRLPAVWYCHLNTWAPELAKCSAPNPAEVDVFLLKQAKRDYRPSKRARASSGDAATGLGGGMTPTSSTDLTKANWAKYGKNSKATVPGGENCITEGNISSNADNSNIGSSTKGRGARANSGSGLSGVKKTVLEWAQCEKCNKWRKLPQHIKSSTLPDKWYCSMNHWDPSHAKCSVPEEVDQESLTLPPHPGSHWHKGGHKAQRTKRGKLSYSELLYGSTGQLRKAYTMESSTLSFEYEGTTYLRDDQYKYSSMYVSPAAMAAAATMAGWSGSDRVNQETNCSTIATAVGGKVDALAAATHPQASVDQVAALVLESMDLRRRRSISELVDAVNLARRGSDSTTTALASLATVTAALGQLEHRGLVEKVDEISETEEDEVDQKRRKTDSLFNDAFSAPIHYRKVPTRPLKASKCWKFGTNVITLPPIQDSQVCARSST